jgi:hypothetical protein
VAGIAMVLAVRELEYVPAANSILRRVQLKRDGAVVPDRANCELGLEGAQRSLTSCLRSIRLQVVRRHLGARLMCLTVSV